MQLVSSLPHLATVPFRSPSEPSVSHTAMAARKSAARVAAEDSIRRILRETSNCSAKYTRAKLLEAYWLSPAERSTWYSAVRSVTGGGVMDIPDGDQRELLDR